MKRHQYGINLDSGIPLKTADDFQLLHVPTEDNHEIEIVGWLRKGETALAIGGQIGSGKTTLLQKAFIDALTPPDVEFHFDRYNVNLSEMDGWVVIFAGLARSADQSRMEAMSVVFPTFKEIFGENAAAWNASSVKILLETFSLEDLLRNQKFKNTLEPLQEGLPLLFRAITDEEEKRINRRLLFFASGVDKFKPGGAAYFSLTPILETLKSYRTLFEVNALHFFSGDKWLEQVEKQMVCAAGKSWIEELLRKRLGAYAPRHKKTIPMLAEFSGGLPRQAIHLLDAYLAQPHSGNIETAIIHSVQHVNREFFAYAPNPDHALLKTIDKQQMLNGGLASLPGDSATAGAALYGNWIILGKHQQDNQWRAFINPIIGKSFFDVRTEDTESTLLKMYARQNDMQANGLDINIQNPRWPELLREAAEHPLKLNIIEIFNQIADSLLSPQRQDRIIMAFENHANIDIVRAWLEAKSSVYDLQTWVHETVECGEGYEPLQKMMDILSRLSVHVYSLEFSGKLTDHQLETLEARRDFFLDKQIIWWIPINDLRKYLLKWSQLRQLFQIFFLEDDLAKALKPAEIQADLDDIQAIAEEGYNYDSVIKNLKKVLEYLNDSKH